MGWQRTSRTLLLTGSAAIGLVCANPALAQQPTPPDHYTLDERGVDLVRGTYTTVATDVVIGQPGNGGLVHARVYANGGWRDTLSGTIAVAGSIYVVSLGAESEVFTLSGSTFTPTSNNGSTLTQSGSILTFTTSSGAVATYSTVWSGATSPYQANGAVLMTHRAPNGETVTYHWDGVTYCSLRDISTGDCLTWANATRVEAVTNNRGYMVKFIYASDDPPEGIDMGWLQRVEAIGINLTVDYCDPNLNSCAGLTEDWPRAIYTTDPFGTRIQSVTDQSDRTSSYTYGAGGITGIRFPGSASDDISITYASDRVASVEMAGSTWSYEYDDSGSTRTATTNNPGAPASTTVAVSNLSIGRLTSFQNELGETTSYQYSQGRLTRATHPEGNYTQYAYGSRGNVSSVTHVPKAGSGLASIVVSATYPSSCSNTLTCNQPTSITDARGSTTDFTYDSSHGGVLTITAPAPAPGEARPQTRFTYRDERAWYYTSPTVISGAPTTVAVPRETRACATGTSCADSAVEVVTTLLYGSAGPSSPSNALPASINQRSGDGSISATSSFTYTHTSDIAAVDGPLSGSADTTHYRYNDARQLEGVIGPDVDGAGPDPRRAVMNVYYPSGRLARTHYGTVTGLTDPDWAAFTTLQRQATVYDTYGRPVERREQAPGGTTRALTQVSYDARGRVECTAFRMNTAEYASLPSSACDLTTEGVFGPDRVSRYAYDAASQVTATTSGYGVDPIIQQFTWTDNGRLETARDGDGNLSTWEYDGFDRVHRLHFPTLSGSTSNPNDYMEYGYDANSNVVMVRPRGNRNPADPVFTTTYDALNRPILRDAPPSVPDVSYAYDNLGRLTGASQPGHAMTWTWDALGRLTGQTDPFGTYGFQYDTAGRRTRITWPDGFYAQYDWSLYNQMTAVRENGATSGAGVLAEYAFDDLGRRTGITRGNGVTTIYGYGELSRLTSIAHDLAGTGDDVTFTMAHNTAGQVISRTISNNAYAYQPANETTDYVINGRNEITSVDGTALTYDADRNLTYDGVRYYTYDGANRMLSVGNSNFSYDPAGNLHQAGNALLLSMVGGERLAIHRQDDGTVNRRIVPGPSLDEPVGYYLGAGTTSSARRWPLADHLGSIVAYADSSADAAVINTYDEYGRGGPDNAERLQYTGQFTLNAALDLINYRNRFYNPRIGRFMQTDPILYGDGMNLYSYVGNDPLNGVDPWGLYEEVEEFRCRATDGPRGELIGVCGWVVVQINLSDYFPGSPTRLGPGGTRRTRPLPTDDFLECRPAQSWRGHVGDFLNDVSSASGAGAVVAAAGAVVTSPTVAGGVTLGGAASVLGTISFASGAAAAAFNISDGRYGNATAGTMSAVAGRGLTGPMRQAARANPHIAGQLNLHSAVGEQGLGVMITC